MKFVARVLLFPVVLLSAFLVLMLKWTLNLSAFVLALPMLYIFGCGLYTLYCQECGVFGSHGKVAAHFVQLCGRSADALHLRLRHLHRLPSNLGSVSYPAGVRVHLLHPLFRCNCHHRGYRAF